MQVVEVCFIAKNFMQLYWKGVSDLQRWHKSNFSWLVPDVAQSPGGNNWSLSFVSFVTTRFLMLVINRHQNYSVAVLITAQELSSV